MSKLSRLVVLVTALASLFAVMSSAAGAVTWTNTGGTAFHATGGPITLSVGSNNLGCSGSTTTATAPMHSGSGLIATGTIVLRPCSIVGQNMFWHCTYTHVGTSFAAGVTAGIMNLTCDQRLTASPANSLCHLSGQTPVTYTNPSGATPGRITFIASSTLTVANGNVACPLGTGHASMSEWASTLTSVAESPVIARHP